MRAREALFSILGSRLSGTAVLDLFAGSGAFALESLSRGAGRALCIDSDREAVRCVAANADACGFACSTAPIAGNAAPAAPLTLWHADACEALQRARAAGLRFDIIFADPPYESPLLAETLPLCAGLLTKDGLCIAESGAPLPPVEGLTVRQTRRYGANHFTFFTTP